MARPRALWSLAFIAFFLIFGAWSVAAPYDGTPDEMQHVIRASGVAGGQIMPEPVRVKGQSGTIQNVSAGLDAPATCWLAKPGVSAACADEPTGGPLVDTPTLAGRYHPLYYAAVGWPLRIWDGWTGVLLARLVSAALSAALLASAFVLLVRSRYGLMLGGLLVASTPILGQMAGAVNPNGLEISSGIALASAGIPLLMGAQRAAARPAFWLLGISAALLATLRSMGPLFLFVGLLAMLLPATRRHFRELLARFGRPLRVVAVVVVVSVALAGVWILLMKTGDLTSPPPKAQLTAGQAVHTVFNQWGPLLQQLVGIAGWLDVTMPLPFYWLWIGIAASLTLFAYVVGSRVDRWRLGVVLIGGALVPSVLQLININTVGYITQGRYMLPVLVFLPLLSAFILERRLLSPRQSHSFTKMCVWALLPIHMVLLWSSMVRWQRGLPTVPTLHHLDPFWGPWRPVLGSWTPLLAMLGGLLLLGALVLRNSARIAAGPVGGDVGGDGAGVEAPVVTAASGVVTSGGESAAVVADVKPATGSTPPHSELQTVRSS
ncbi:DUF2142 domain-containing protein [Longispora sp. NPDC051575]|uniref:DUF2142 domain-containing protein n=1 Tax=Longispora sp. NPDC051575 TaxID=3154943 RepID=UPI00341E2856